MKKAIIAIFVALVLAGASIAAVGAATTCICGHLSTSNPIYSAPYGIAGTFGYRYCTARCSVYKEGYATNSVSTGDDLSTTGGYLETSKLYGPTYASSGTQFSSYHTGYSTDGEYQTEYHSASY